MGGVDRYCAVVVGRQASRMSMHLHIATSTLKIWVVPQICLLTISKSIAMIPNRTEMHRAGGCTASIGPKYAQLKPETAGKPPNRSGRSAAPQ